MGSAREIAVRLTIDAKSALSGVDQFEAALKRMYENGVKYDEQLVKSKQSYAKEVTKLSKDMANATVDADKKAAADRKAQSANVKAALLDDAKEVLAANIRLNAERVKGAQASISELKRLEAELADAKLRLVQKGIDAEKAAFADRLKNVKAGSAEYLAIEKQRIDTLTKLEAQAGAAAAKAQSARAANANRGRGLGNQAFKQAENASTLSGSLQAGNVAGIGAMFGPMGAAIGVAVDLIGDLFTGMHKLGEEAIHTQQKLDAVFATITVQGGTVAVGGFEKIRVELDSIQRPLGLTRDGLYAIAQAAAGFAAPDELASVVESITNLSRIQPGTNTAKLSQDVSDLTKSGRSATEVMDVLAATANSLRGDSMAPLDDAVRGITASFNVAKTAMADQDKALMQSQAIYQTLVQSGLDPAGEAGAAAEKLFKGLTDAVNDPTTLKTLEKALPEGFDLVSAGLVQGDVDAVKFAAAIEKMGVKGGEVAQILGPKLGQTALQGLRNNFEQTGISINDTVAKFSDVEGAAKRTADAFTPMSKRLEESKKQLVDDAWGNFGKNFAEGIESANEAFIDVFDTIAGSGSAIADLFVDYDVRAEQLNKVAEASSAVAGELTKLVDASANLEGPAFFEELGKSMDVLKAQAPGLAAELEDITRNLAPEGTAAYNEQLARAKGLMQEIKDVGLAQEFGAITEAIEANSLALEKAGEKSTGFWQSMLDGILESTPALKGLKDLLGVDVTSSFAENIASSKEELAGLRDRMRELKESGAKIGVGESGQELAEVMVKLNAASKELADNQQASNEYAAKALDLAESQAKLMETANYADFTADEKREQLQVSILASMKDQPEAAQELLKHLDEIAAGDKLRIDANGNIVAEIEKQGEGLDAVAEAEKKAADEAAKRLATQGALADEVAAELEEASKLGANLDRNNVKAIKAIDEQIDKINTELESKRGELTKEQIADLEGANEALQKHRVELEASAEDEVKRREDEAQAHQERMAEFANEKQSLSQQRDEGKISAEEYISGLQRITDAQGAHLDSTRDQYKTQAEYDKARLEAQKELISAQKAEAAKAEKEAEDARKKAQKEAEELFKQQTDAILASIDATIKRTEIETKAASEFRKALDAATRSAREGLSNIGKSAVDAVDELIQAAHDAARGRAGEEEAIIRNAGRATAEMVAQLKAAAQAADTANQAAQIALGNARAAVGQVQLGSHAYGLRGAGNVDLSQAAEATFRNAQATIAAMAHDAAHTNQENDQHIVDFIKELEAGDTSRGHAQLEGVSTDLGIEQRRQLGQTVVKAIGALFTEARVGLEEKMGEAASALQTQNAAVGASNDVQLQQTQGNRIASNADLAEHAKALTDLATSYHEIRAEADAASVAAADLAKSETASGSDQLAAYAKAAQLNAEATASLGRITEEEAKITEAQSRVRVTPETAAAIEAATKFVAELPEAVAANPLAEFMNQQAEALNLTEPVYEKARDAVQATLDSMKLMPSALHAANQAIADQTAAFKDQLDTIQATIDGMKARSASDAEIAAEQAKWDKIKAEADALAASKPQQKLAAVAKDAKSILDTLTQAVDLADKGFDFAMTMGSNASGAEKVQAGADLAKQVGGILMSSPIPGLQIAGAVLVGAGMIVGLVTKIVSAFAGKQETAQAKAERLLEVEQRINDVYEARMKLIEAQAAFGEASLNSAREQLTAQREALASKSYDRYGTAVGAFKPGDIGDFHFFEDKLTEAQRQLDKINNLVGEANRTLEFGSSSEVDAYVRKINDALGTDFSTNKNGLEDAIAWMDAEGGVWDEKARFASDMLAGLQDLQEKASAVTEQDIKLSELRQRLGADEATEVQNRAKIRRQALNDAIAAAGMGDASAMSTEDMKAWIAWQSTIPDALGNDLLGLIDNWLGATDAVDEYAKSVAQAAADSQAFDTRKKNLELQRDLGRITEEEFTAQMKALLEEQLAAVDAQAASYDTILDYQNARMAIELEIQNLLNDQNDAAAEQEKILTAQIVARQRALELARVTGDYTKIQAATEAIRKELEAEGKSPEEVQQFLDTLPTFAKGGYNAEGGPAMLHPGEFVLRREAVDAIGRSMLERANAMSASNPLSLFSSSAARMISGAAASAAGGSASPVSVVVNVTINGNADSATIAALKQWGERDIISAVSRAVSEGRIPLSR